MTLIFYDHTKYTITRIIELANSNQNNVNSVSGRK
jgi:hypothetical protein